jgi:hypothetical protein
MNASNRTLGRIVLVVVGLVLLVGGLGAVALETVPQVTSWWRDGADGWLGPWGSGADRPAATGAWGIALGVAVVVGVLALVVLATRGGGRTGVVVADTGGASGIPGEVRIDAAAVQHALSSAIGDLPQVASLAVDVYRVRRRRAIRIKVRPRRGAAPREIVTRVESIVDDLDALLGERLPVLLQVARGGHGSSVSDRVH